MLPNILPFLHSPTGFSNIRPGPNADNPKCPLLHEFSLHLDHDRYYGN